MKLISLNAWGGKLFIPLMKFIKQSSKNTDIFCLQEIYDTSSGVKQYKNVIQANLLAELKKILKEFRVFYFPYLFGFDEEGSKVNFDLSYGQAIFIKKSIKIIENKNYFIYKNKSLHSLMKNFSNLSTPLQYIKLSLNNKTFAVFNFHGTPYPAAKKDTIKRLKQTRKIKKIIETGEGAKILVGDFNLSLYTESIKLLENNMINLIKKFNIKKTRSKLSPYYGNRNFQRFADYTFVSRDINILDFKVPHLKVSDHLPMILEFS